MRNMRYNPVTGTFEEGQEPKLDPKVFSNEGSEMVRGIARQIEESEWKYAMEFNTRHWYEKYIKNYPNGVHVTEARRRLEFTLNEN